jgi:hypothetical protein
MNRYAVAAIYKFDLLASTNTFKYSHNSLVKETS